MLSLSGVSNSALKHTQLQPLHNCTYTNNTPHTLYNVYDIYDQADRLLNTQTRKHPKTHLIYCAAKLFQLLSLLILTKDKCPKMLLLVVFLVNEGLANITLSAKSVV